MFIRPEQLISPTLLELGLCFLCYLFNLLRDNLLLSFVMGLFFTSKMCMNFDEDGIDWQSRSSSSNPIQHVWDIIYRRVLRRPEQTSNLIQVILNKRKGVDALPTDDVSACVSVPYFTFSHRQWLESRHCKLKAPKIN